MSAPAVQYMTPTDEGEAFMILDRRCSMCNFEDTYAVMDKQGVVTACWCPDCEAPLDYETGDLIVGPSSSDARSEQ